MWNQTEKDPHPDLSRTEIQWVMPPTASKGDSIPPPPFYYKEKENKIKERKEPKTDLTTDVFIYFVYLFVTG